MRLGAVVPYHILAGQPDSIEPLAAALEDLAFSHVIAFDHVLGVDPARHVDFSGPHDVDDPFFDPWSVLSYVAARTRRLELVTGVLVLPLRSTALVARQAADLQLLSRGRLRMGVGIGWNRLEFDALGVDFDERADRCEEQIELLRALWSRRAVHFSGRFHHLDGVGINPRPAEAIPIWMGGASRSARTRAARFAEGFVFTAANGDPVRQLIAIREELAAVDRDPSAFGYELLIAERDPDSVARQILHWHSVGGTHAGILVPRRINGVAEAIEHLNAAAGLTGVLGRT